MQPTVELKTIAKPSYEEVENESPIDELQGEEVSVNNWSLSYHLYYYRKILNFQSIRDLQYAIQFTSSFVVSAAIAYSSDAFSRGTAGLYLLPWVTPLMLMDSVAGTIIQCRACLFAYVPMAVFLYILIQIGMGYRDYVSSTILFFCTCFYVGYLYDVIAFRKVALILPIVYFVTLVNTPTDVLPDNFVWEVLSVVLMGLCLNMAVTLFVFPRYACLECQDRFSYSLARNEEVLELAMQAMFSSHRANAEVFLCEANAIIAQINANQEVMYTRSAIASWEPISWIRFFFRNKQTLFNSYSIPDLTQISAYLTWHSTATVHAAAHMNFNEFHSVVTDLCRDSFLSAENQYKRLIRMLRSRVHNKAQINQQIEELKKALDHMHARLSESYRAGDKIVSGKEPASPVFSGKYMSDAESESSKRTATRDGSTSAASGGTKLYEGDNKKESNRLTFSYWLFHMSELIQTVENKFWTNEEGHIASTYSVKSGDSKTTNYALFLSIASLPVTMVVNFYKDFIKDWRSKLRTGFHTALLLGVGLIFAEVPRMTRKFENGQWIMFAMLMSTGDNLGNSFHVMRNRFLGTLFGAIYGYFVFIAVGAKYEGIIGIYVPFLLLCGVIKQNKLWGYFGSISATTALIITFGRVPYEDPLAGDYSLLRIQQNVIGILLSLCLNLMSVPIFATDLLKHNIVKVFCQLGQATTAIGEAYVSTVTSVNLTKSSDETYDIEANMVELEAVEQAKKELKILFIQPLVTAVKSGISQQPTLIEQSTFETLFWSKAMPESVYLQLITCERKVLHMLVTIDRALLRISKISDLKAAENCLLFARSISRRVTTLLEQVSKNLNLWSSEMRASMWHDLCEDDSEVVRVNHVRTREEHLQGLELMDQSAKSIARDGLKFNKVLIAEWMEDFAKLPTDKSRIDVTEANIHHMYDILTMFNALFYASSHLAMATSELGNTVFMILLLERKKSHKPF